METPVNRIESLLYAWKHRTWGFVIYRCTYSSDSDSDFAALNTALKSFTSENLEAYGGDVPPTAQQISWEVVEDRDQLDGASTADVRELFEEWCQSPDAASEQTDSLHPVAENPNARYGFCVHVDQAALDSLKGERQLWVNMNMRKWPYGLEYDDDDDDDDDEYEDDGLEVIEGSNAEDIGWCKVRISSLLPDSFSQLCHANAWYHFYQRPPAVV